MTSGLERCETATGVLIAIAAACARVPDAACVRDRRMQDWSSAIVSCAAELSRTQQPARAVDAAMAALYLSRPHEAVRFAEAALHGPTAGDAHFIIGAAQLSLDQPASAQVHLVLAATLHQIAGDERAQARDFHQLSGVSYKRGDYRAAMGAEQATRTIALRAHDDAMAIYADIARADILREIGELHSAEAAIQQALLTARQPTDRAYALLKRGILHLEQGHPGLARAPLVEALQLASTAPSPSLDILAALHLNLSYVERKAGAYPRAFDEVEQAKRCGTDAMSYYLNRGLVYADEGNLPLAAADLAIAEAENPDGEWAWWVPFQRARVLARLHEDDAAIAADRRAIARIASFASDLGVLGATMIAQHRGPYLHLVGMLAARQRWADVLDVVAAMDEQSLVASTAEATDFADSMHRPVPTGATRARPIASPGAAQDIVDAWRGHQLVIVVPGGDRIWRLDVSEGQIAGTDAGDARGLTTLARALETAPDDAEAGRKLAAAMLAPDLAPDRRVAMLVIGPMARAPLAGLRIGDELAAVRYPLVRVPGVLPRAFPRRPTTGVVAIGDPGGDLPASAREARDVAAQLRGSALVGPAATRAGLASATAVRVLHVAAHTTHGSNEAMLELADGPLTATEIARLALVPDLVVLASCGAAAGRDDAGNGSVAQAFLDAGARTVVATRWSISDAGAAELMAAFYRAGGDRDAVQALGHAQRTSTLPASTWAAFEVFVARPER